MECTSMFPSKLVLSIYFIKQLDYKYKFLSEKNELKKEFMMDDSSYANVSGDIPKK
jgi:hypothetical protein